MFGRVMIWFLRRCRRWRSILERTPEIVILIPRRLKAFWQRFTQLVWKDVVQKRIIERRSEIRKFYRLIDQLQRNTWCSVVV